MIVHLPKSDSKGEKLVAFLRREQVDFEQLVKDRQVFHILGQLTPAQQKAVKEIVGESLSEPTPAAAFSSFSAAKPVIIAGPCAVESEQQMQEIAAFLYDKGIRYMRGGAFKPRTSPHSFQGLGVRGLQIMKQIKERYHLKIVTEVLDRSQIDLVYDVADILQVGSRNMFNYSLLVALGAMDKPILLKRGMSATVDEWLASAEYIRQGGNQNIILCERGIRSFEPRVRNILDVAAIPIAKSLTNFPVIADPSHAAGRADLVVPLAKAALSAGADGLLIEIHPNPAKALSDGPQSLNFEEFTDFLEDVRRVREHGQKV